MNTALLNQSTHPHGVKPPPIPMPGALVDVVRIEEHALKTLSDFAATRGLRVEFFRLVDFARIRAFRFLNDQWRPSTQLDAGH